MKDYTTFKCNDYLADDFFVKGMLFPSEKTKLFWQEMVDQKRIDVDEFIAANMIMKTFEKNKIEMSPVRMEILWKRIAVNRNSQQRKRKKILLCSSIFVAACFIGLAIFFFSKQVRKEDKEIDYTDYQIINRQQTPNEILIITDNKQMKVVGNNPKVSYDPGGTLSVNDQTLNTEKLVNQTAEAILNRIYVPFGKRAQLKLSDSTILWINTGTKVVYPSVFSDEKREIYIDGEIYAAIKQDIDRPFIVKTEDMEIRVFGTEFNLSAYKNDELKQVVLVNGSVDVKQHGNNLRMNPNQLFSITKNGNSLKSVNTEIYTSWRKGEYIFENEPIEAILLKLSRYYNVTMVLPQRPSGIVCFGKLELKDDLSTLLNGMSHIASFNFAIKDENQYWIQFN